jgi:GTP cyclohydrolase I
MKIWHPRFLESRRRKQKMQKLFRDFLVKLGEDPEREGLQKTPERMEKAYHFLTSGYREDAKDILERAVFSEKYDEMVVVKDVDIYSLCEHHLLPFFGKCHVAYIPDGKIIGLSKIPRIIEVFSRRLQVQERLTTEISTAIADTIRPKGVAVVIEAFHLCMRMRGVENQSSYAITSSMQGIFRQDEKTRLEFLHLIRGERSINL